MPSRSKAKGNRFERECVKKAQSKGLESKRAWGSDGRSLGLDAEVDLIIEDYTVQCKVRKRVAEWLKPMNLPNHVQLVKEDRGEIYTIMRMEMFLEIIKALKETSQQQQK